MKLLITNFKKNKYHFILLTIWIVLGGILRFKNLDLKSPWADEWATLVFSLGNSFLTVTLEQITSLDNVLQPLQLRESIVVGDVIHNLLTESTHPPIYFILTHLWLNLLTIKSGLVSIALARSLSVVFGIVSIPSIFCLSSLVSSSLIVGQISAALMAFSPYGVYLAQETRHYTLTILLIMASLACLVNVVKSIQKQKLITYSLVITWIIINSLGVATHYFFALALVSEILVLANWLIKDLQKQTFSFSSTAPWRRISIAILGTIAGCSVWVWTWLNIPEDRLTDWTKQGLSWGIELFAPVGRIIGWIATMILLLPIEGTPLWITIVSVIIALIILALLLKATIEYFKKSPKFLDKQVISKYIFWAILLVFSFAYLGDRDLTLAARFQFFYFPAIIILVALVLNYCWQQKENNRVRNLVILVLFCSFIGSLTVVNNYAYQKPDRADLVAPIIREAQIKNNGLPILIATVHKTHEQTGEMMGIAWEWTKQVESKVTPPNFLLLHKKPDVPEQTVTNNFRQQLIKIPRPFDVWVVNFSAPTGLEKQNCIADLDYKRRVSGYRFRLYHCR